VLQTESSLDAAQALAKQYEETDRVALQYLAQESVLKSDSLQVKAKLAQSRYQIIQLRDTLDTQKEHLNELLGRDLDIPFRTEAVPPISPAEMDLKVARQTALQQRPEIKEAAIDVSRANYDKKLAKAKYIPDVGAAIHYLDPINTEVLPQNILSAGVELKWDPFDWGGRRDEVQQKDVSLQQSHYQLQETQAQVLLDVDNNFRKLGESRSLLEVAQAGRDAANEKMREVSDQFKHSAVLLRDVLEQQAAVANADHDYEESLLSFWNAKALFEKALGEE
jgi:outer membrane protein TolC